MLDDFIEDIFVLARNRITADNLTIPLSGKVPGDGSAPKKDDMQRPLNTILYGPPGTGKTYATTRRCVEICDGQVARSDEEVRNRYRELVQTGRVEFITFHQSYGYEEFVEGLRPDAGSGSPPEGKKESKGECRGGFKLVAVDGVLKRVAKRARSPVERQVSIDLVGRQFFKMALGNPQEAGEREKIFEACIKHGRGLLGSWGKGEVDLSDPRFGNQDEVLARLQEMDADMTRHHKMYQALRYFRCEMKAGDIVIVPDGLTHFCAVGEITGEYEFVAGNSYAYCHRREVRWYWWDDTSRDISEIYARRLTPGAVYRLNPKEIQHDALRSRIRYPMQSEPEPYVLVIDEINRGNVSKVMGER